MSLATTTRTTKALCAATSACLLAACSPYRYERPTTPISEPAPPVVQPAVSARGNPAFYDVMGKRYFVMKSRDGYQERGVASWYGPKFHGKPTASGERYDMHQMTAAHKTLPIPTWVEVTNLKNQRSVLVKVNDRGPFVHNRIIDLSYAAANKIGMVEAGTTLVEVRLLGAPKVPSSAQPAVAAVSSSSMPIASQPAAAQTGEQPAPQPRVVATATPVPPVSQPAPEPAVQPDLRAKRLYVQVGAFAERDNAVRLAGQLKRQGVLDVFVLSERIPAKDIHRVRIGPVIEVVEYDQIVAKLETLGFTETHLVSEE